ncbi:hypothetical protein chiPu_0008429 [Chiloscyllium punctatum]|uniref:Uncharacterized protein n=1 Tax=Chiloscyllium punctatum TaxID=137246 RepID=A0A401SI13_CHIPU|nr:hypothetical protein [Chiloscyllium punctatum]
MTRYKSSEQQVAPAVQTQSVQFSAGLTTDQAQRLHVLICLQSLKARFSIRHENHPDHIVDSDCSLVLHGRPTEAALFPSTACSHEVAWSPLNGCAIHCLTGNQGTGFQKVAPGCRSPPTAVSASRGSNG